MTNRSRCFALLCAAALVGCGGTTPLPRGTAQGRVTLNGKPLTGATVVFESKAVGVCQSAALDDDGRYEFVAYNAAGLPAARYKVTVSGGRFMKPGEEIPRVTPAAKGVPLAARKPDAVVPDKYTKAESSGLSADVNAGDNPPFDFDLKS